MYVYMIFENLFSVGFYLFGVKKRQNWIYQFLAGNE